MTQPWYPFYWSDYSGKTMHLTMGQHGAYMLFLRWIYTTGKPIPDKQRYSIARAMVEQEKSDADAVLSEFFTLNDGHWSNDRAFEVMDEQEIKHQRRVNAGKLGGEAKSSNAKAMPEHSPSNQNQNQNQNQIDNTNVLSPPISPKLFAEFWDLYPRQRRGSKDKALTSYKAAQKRGNTEQQIIEGVKTYAASSDVTRGYAKGCAAWLNDDGFNNQYLPVGAQGGRATGGNRGFDALAAAATKISESVDREAERLRREDPVLYFQRLAAQSGGSGDPGGSHETPDAIEHHAAPPGLGYREEGGSN